MAKEHEHFPHSSAQLKKRRSAEFPQELPKLLFSLALIVALVLVYVYRPTLSLIGL